MNEWVKLLSRVQLFAIPWTVAYQAPPSIEFSRQEYWSGLPFPSPEIFSTQGLNPGLLHCKQMLYRLSHQRNHMGHQTLWESRLDKKRKAAKCLILATPRVSLNQKGGTSLVVQWLGLHAPNAGSLGSIPGQGTTYYMPQLRVHMS